MVEFKDLPLEIRSEIWAECLTNADLRGVYFFDPEDFGIKEESEGDQDESDWEVEPEVILAFPTVMHVCRESREYAKTQLSFREDTDTGISIPCRPYSPQKDAFFVPHRHFDKFLEAVRKAQDDEYTGKLPDGAKAFCREIVHLGFSSRILMNEDVDALAYFVVEMTALRVISFVFGNTDTLDLSKPLAMADLTIDRVELVPGKPRTRIHVEETLDNLMGQASLWELSDKDMAPWNEWTGEWVFDMVGKSIKRVRGLV